MIDKDDYDDIVIGAVDKALRGAIREVVSERMRAIDSMIEASSIPVKIVIEDYSDGFVVRYDTPDPDDLLRLDEHDHTHRAMPRRDR